MAGLLEGFEPHADGIRLTYFSAERNLERDQRTCRKTFTSAGQATAKQRLAILDGTDVRGDAALGSCDPRAEEMEQGCDVHSVEPPDDYEDDGLDDPNGMEFVDEPNAEPDRTPPPSTRSLPPSFGLHPRSAPGSAAGPSPGPSCHPGLRLSTEEVRRRMPSKRPAPVVAAADRDAHAAVETPVRKRMRKQTKPKLTVDDALVFLENAAQEVISNDPMALEDATLSLKLVVSDCYNRMTAF